MTGAHWTGLLLGAATGIAIAWALHRFAEFDDPTVDEAPSPTLVFP